MDPSWVWKLRTGKNYSGYEKVKPATWIIVAKDHYEGLEPHVTLLSAELIAKHTFDNNTNPNRISNNHWGASGTGNATHSLRPWLNSIGIHAGKGFYRSFSGSFKEAVIETTLPNKEWKNGTFYSTQDYVFIPSTTELGDTKNTDTYQIGVTYPFFQRAVDKNRVACLDGESQYYWTRSPDSDRGALVRLVSSAGEFGLNLGSRGSCAVRPALNLKSGSLVSEIKD